jgi:hypothetical protein
VACGSFFRIALLLSSRLAPVTSIPAMPHPQKAYSNLGAIADAVWPIASRYLIDREIGKPAG